MWKHNLAPISHFTYSFFRKWPRPLIPKQSAFRSVWSLHLWRQYFLNCSAICNQTWYGPTSPGARVCFWTSWFVQGQGNSDDWQFNFKRVQQHTGKINTRSWEENLKKLIKKIAWLLVVWLKNCWPLVILNQYVWLAQ